MINTSSPKRIAYLFGAGATQACLDFVSSEQKTLMRDLGTTLLSRLSELVRTEYSDDDALNALVNDVVDDETDYEHVITFFHESPSARHRQFAADAQERFRAVLTDTFADVVVEQGELPDHLYYGLLDLHSLDGFPEVLSGFLTLNYDEYLEHAIRRSPVHSLDPGIHIASEDSAHQLVRVLKLHGGFSWTGGWPIATGITDSEPVWIPPGIHKTKAQYPFNLLWGLAREVLNCDVLRIIGCNLGANDWDLISLLFTTRHADRTSGPYRVEVIDSPKQALKLQIQFPYLDVKSILEIDSLGPALMSGFTDRAEVPFSELSPEEQGEVAAAIPWDNWFFLWLKHKAEDSYAELSSVETELGFIQNLLGGHP